MSRIMTIIMVVLANGLVLAEGINPPITPRAPYRVGAPLTPVERFIPTVYNPPQYDAVLKGRVMDCYAVAPTGDVHFVFDCRKDDFVKSKWISGLGASLGDATCIAPEKISGLAFVRLEFLTYWVARVLPEGTDEEPASNTIFVVAAESHVFRETENPKNSLSTSQDEQSSIWFGLAKISYAEVMESFKERIVWRKNQEMSFLETALIQYGLDQSVVPPLGQPVTAELFPPDAEYYVVTDIAIDEEGAEAMAKRMEKWIARKARKEEREKKEEEALRREEQRQKDIKKRMEESDKEDW